ncbi:MAG: diguanylate cyclase [Psychromonas sp.]
MNKKAMVLIVSPSSSDTQTISASIASKYDFKNATSAPQCLQIAHDKEPPDLIIIDTALLGNSGYELCKRLKSDTKTRLIPIIFVNDSDNEEMISLGLESGADDFLTKPVSPALTFARVKTHIRFKLQLQKLSEMAYNDPLTGLYNRHLLEDLGAKKVARAMRHKYNLWLLVIEIDQFQTINAEFGRGAGDRLLIQIADTLKADSRREDLVACSSSEHFVMVFDPCGDIEAHNKALRISDKISKLIINDKEITASIGIAKLLDRDMDFERLMIRANEALVRVKENPDQRIEFAASY